MEHVAHQCICMQYILELSKQLDVDPRACVGSFFSRIQIAEVEYKNSFDDELRAFKDRIRKRAAEKVADAVREAEEEEKKARLGPGGLDPVEVFESLPEVKSASGRWEPTLRNFSLNPSYFFQTLQKCFEMQDIPLLQQTIAAMPEEEATYHMKRCVDSGLWVPDAKNKEKEKEKENKEEEEEQQSAAGKTPDPE